MSNEQTNPTPQAAATAIMPRFPGYREMAVEEVLQDGDMAMYVWNADLEPTNYPGHVVGEKGVGIYFRPIAIEPTPQAPAPCPGRFPFAGDFDDESMPCKDCGVRLGDHEPKSTPKTTEPKAAPEGTSPALPSEPMHLRAEIDSRDKNHITFYWGTENSAEQSDHSFADPIVKEIADRVNFDRASLVSSIAAARAFFAGLSVYGFDGSRDPDWQGKPVPPHWMLMLPMTKAEMSGEAGESIQSKGEKLAAVLALLESQALVGGGDR